MMRTVTIANHRVGEGRPCFIIAEAGINHNGDLGIAKRLADAAKEVGADAIKFQTYRTEAFLSKHVIPPKHVKGEGVFELLKRLELSPAAWRELAAHCRRIGIIFMSTPLDVGSVDLLDRLGVPVFKVASCDLDALPLLRHIAKKGKPIVLSTGMGTIGEVEEAIGAINGAGNRDIILLHCVSLYPPKDAEINLRAMDTLKSAFGLPVGYSDHSLDIAVPLAAVARGARAIEKHFTLDKNMEGPDQAISADPAEFKRLVSGIRAIEAALRGSGIKMPSENERQMIKAFRRSIVAAADIRKGEMLRERSITFKRPGTGLSPKHSHLLVGKRATRRIGRDDFITLSDVS